MSMRKYCLAAVLGTGFFGMFSLLGTVVELTNAALLLLILVSCFETLGVEKLLCLDPVVRPRLFVTRPYLLATLGVPLLFYTIAAAANAGVFAPSAKVCLGTCLFRLIYGATKHYFRS